MKQTMQNSYEKGPAIPCHRAVAASWECPILTLTGPLGWERESSPRNREHRNYVFSLLSTISASKTLKVQVERDSQSIHLAIRRFAGVVLMLVVNFDLGMLTYGERTAQGPRGSAPFLVIAVEVHLAADVG